jgi:hypothetical protein
LLEGFHADRFCTPPAEFFGFPAFSVCLTLQDINIGFQRLGALFEEAILRVSLRFRNGRIGNKPEKVAFQNYDYYIAK